MQARSDTIESLARRFGPIDWARYQIAVLRLAIIEIGRLPRHYLHRCLQASARFGLTNLIKVVEIFRPEDRADSATNPPPRASIDPIKFKVVDRRRIARDPENSRSAPSLGSEPHWRIIDFALGLLAAATVTPLDRSSGFAALGSDVRRHGAIAAVVGKWTASKSIRDEIFAHAADPQSIWNAAALQWLLREAPTDTDLAQKIHDRLVLDGFAAVGSHESKLLLRLCSPCAAILPTSAASAILVTLLTRVEATIDPYEDNSVLLAIRRAVVDLLAARPDLDNVVFERAQGQGLSKGMPLPVSLELLGLASRSRQTGRQGAFVTAIKSSGLTDTQIDELAEAFDSVLTRVVSPASAGSVQRGRTALHVMGRRVLVPLGTIVICGFVGWWAGSHAWQPLRGLPALAEGIAALAAVVTVNVFTVQLSASRLPGLVARAAGHPWHLTVSYVTSVGLITCSLAAQARPGLLSPLSWASAAAVIIFVIALVAAVIRLVRRTDAAEATNAFIELKSSLYMGRAREFGKAQARALDINRRLEALPAIRRRLAPMAGERSENVYAPRRGILWVNERRLTKLLSTSAFREGMTLQVFNSVGTIVPERDPVFSLTPTTSQVVPRRLLRAAARCIVIRPSSGLEEIASALVALAGLAAGLEKSGDRGTAHRVASAATRMLESNLTAIRRSRRDELRRQLIKDKIIAGGPCEDGLGADRRPNRRDVKVRDDELAVVYPPLKEMFAFAVKTRINDPGSSTEITNLIVKDIMEATGTADAIGAYIPLTLPTRPGELVCDFDVLTNLVHTAGTQALANDDRMAWERALDWLSRVSRHKNWYFGSVTTLSELGATACWFSSTRAELAAERLIRIQPEQGADNAWLAAMWRVGAAALGSGAFPVATRCLRELSSRKLGSRISSMVDAGLAESEAARARLLGRYLGENAEDSLVAFSKALSELEPLLSSANQALAQP